MENTGLRPPSSQADSPLPQSDDEAHRSQATSEESTDAPRGFFHDESAVEQAEPVASAERAGSQTVTWTASEFIAHEKSIGWYAGLVLAAFIIVALTFLITKDRVSVGVVVVAALMFGIYGARNPRQLQYQIDNSGIGIGRKRYEFREFRSFAILPEGAFSSIIFMPLKRFAPLMTIYYAPEDEERIIKLLADQLPLEEYKPDAVDRLMRRIRF